MIAIRMRFLAGRLHATPWGHHVNEGVVEYPPSLFRLLRSLIATARRASVDDVREEQLSTIVTALCAPPNFHLPQASIAHTRHYDNAHGTPKQRDGKLRIIDIPFFFDTFVALDPQDELLWYWPDGHLEESDREALGKLLTALGTFGRAESWCEAALLTEKEGAQFAATPELINSQPFDKAVGPLRQETIRLLIPQEELKPEELLRVLETETSAMRKSRQLEPTGTSWLTYARPAGVLTPRSARPSIRAKSPAVIVARFALDSNVLPLAQDSLPFAEQVRRALIRNRVDTSHSEAITGKRVDGVPLEGHEHAHYFATDEDGDGRLDHVTIYCPRGFDEADVEALGSLRTIHRQGNRPEVRMILIGLHSGERLAERAGSLSQAGSIAALTHPPAQVVLTSTPSHPLPQVLLTSRRWRSVTPFSLPRFPNRGGGKPPRPRDLPEAQLTQELIARGFPVPISIKRIDGYQPSGRPMVRWLEFHTQRFKGTQGKGLAGFEIEFAEPVAGPIAVGFGCHFGLGLFMPC